MSNRTTNLTSSRNPLSAFSNFFQREKSAMKTTPLSAALGQPTDDKSNKKSSGKKVTSADKKELSIKDKLDKAQPEAHRKGEEQSKYSLSAPSPKSNVAREALPARQEFHSEPKRLAMAEKAGGNHAGKAEKKESAEGSEKSGKGAGIPDKHAKPENSTNSSTTPSRSTTQRSGTSKTSTSSTTSTTSTATSTSLSTALHSSERRSSLSSSEEDPPVTYEDLSKLMKELGKTQSPSQNTAKADKAGHSSRREKSPPSGTHHRKASAPQSKADRSAILSSSLEEPEYKKDPKYGKEPTYENVKSGEIHTHSKSKSPPQRSARAENSRHGHQPETSPPQKKNSPPQKPGACRTLPPSSGGELTDTLVILDPRKGTVSSAVRGLSPELVSMNAQYDQRYQSIPPVTVSPVTTHSAKSAGGLSTPSLTLGKGPATSQAMPYGAAAANTSTSASTAATAKAYAATHSDTAAGVRRPGTRRGSADESSSSSSRRDTPKHKAVLGKSRSYTTSEKPYDDSSFSDSGSDLLGAPIDPSLAIAKSIMEKKHATAKIATWRDEEPEWPGTSGFVSRPGNSNWDDDMSTASGSDDDTFMTPDRRAKGYPPPIEFKPNPFGAAHKFVVPAIAAIAAGETTQFKVCIQSMKQAIIATGNPEHSADFDAAFAQALTRIFMELTEHHPATRMRWFAEWMWSAFPAWKMEVPWFFECYPIVEMWQRRDYARLDTYLEHHWRVGGRSAVGTFNYSVDALAEVLTGKLPGGIPWHRPELLPPPPLPSECLALRERMKHVPPAIMQACRPDGDKVVTAGAARFVRDWIPALRAKWKESLSTSQLHDYIKLACQHDSGYTIKTLLFSELHPDLGASENIGAHASILKTERIRVHIRQVASAFGAKKIQAYLKHWPELMEMYMEPGVYAHQLPQAYITRLESLIGRGQTNVERDEQDMDIPDPVARNTVHTSSH